MIWSFWVLIGIGILVLEFFIPSAFFLFVIGISAIITGGILGTEVFSNTANFQYGLFAALLVFNFIFVRKQIAERFLRASPGVGDEFVGGEVEITSEIQPGSEGKGNYRGSAWVVRNVGSSVVNKGDVLKIVSRSGLTLVVAKN